MLFRVRTYPVYDNESLLSSEIDRSLGELMNAVPELPVKMPGFTPRIDVTELDRAYQVTVELPGVAKDDVSLKAENGVLTVHGTRKPEDNGAKAVRSERAVGEFSRSLELPDGVDGSGITAALENGLLTISLPKLEQSLPREIRIR